MKRLQRETGITFIFVTHDQEEALSMSDRIAVMSAGKLQQIGSPAEIYEHPANRFVADFIGETNLLDAEITEVDGPTVTCKLPDGEVLRADAQGVVTTGQTGAVSLRPERLTLTTTQPEGESLHGTLVDLTYLGTDTTYTVELSEKLRLTVRHQNRQTAQDAPQLGEPVFVRIADNAARCLLYTSPSPRDRQKSRMPSSA